MLFENYKFKGKKKATISSCFFVLDVSKINY